MQPDRRRTRVRGALSAVCVSILTHRLQPLFLAALAILLVLPSITGGWALDDHFHRITLLGSRAFDDLLPPPMDLFRFLDGDAQRAFRAIDVGFLPWWTYTGMKAAFWRPVTVLTHWLDYHLWPASPALMHAHSLLWFGALVAAVAALYRRLMVSPWLAGVAALLYAIDDAHGMPVGFLANRNALISALFGVLAILAHDRWRRGGWRAGAVFGPLLLALSLLAKEAGIATCAYLAAHALFVDRASWRRRAAALLPYAAVVIAWRAAWSGLGYGVAHAGLYIDPLVDPLSFAVAVIQRAPIYLLGQWAAPPGELALFLSAAKVRVLWLAALAFVALLTALLVPLLLRDRSARFWAVGMALSLLPACATFPADRLLFFIGIGAMGLLARFWEGAFGRAAWRPSSAAWRVPAAGVGAVFVLLHLIVAPVALPLRAAYADGGKFAEQFQVRTPFDAAVEQQDVILVNPPSILHIAYSMIEREMVGQPVPRRMRALAPGLQPIVIQRPDARTLLIRPKNGYLAWIFEHLFRDDEHAMAVGQRVELTGLAIEVIELTADRRPAAVKFRFAVPLEDASLRWLHWDHGNFIPFTPPPVGETIELRPQMAPLWE